MKIHLAWIRVTATAAILAGAGAQPSGGAVRPVSTDAASPRRPPFNRPRRRRRVYAAQQPYWQQAAQQAQSPTYQAPAAPAATAAQYPQTSAAYVPTATAMPAYAPTPAYAPAPVVHAGRPVLPAGAAVRSGSAYAPTAAQYQPYPRVAYQQPEAAAARRPRRRLKARCPRRRKPEAPANGARQANGMNGHVHNGHMHNGYVHNGQSMPSYAAGCNCSTNGYPAGSYYTGDQACGDGYGLERLLRRRAATTRSGSAACTSCSWNAIGRRRRS